MSDVTRLLQAARDDAQAQQQLLDLVYDELHRRAELAMRGESSGHTLQPTALVHDVWEKLTGQRDVEWQGRAHFYALASKLMRRILVDHARARLRQKRGGDVKKVALDDAALDHAVADAPSLLSAARGDDVLAVDEALEKLAQLDARQARIVEMRFFVGLTVDEVAEVLGVSRRTVEAEWTMVKAWLRKELAR
jgi:RNA polymerase sigma-70 factor, ECF subfamily